MSLSRPRRTDPDDPTAVETPSSDWLWPGQGTGALASVPPEGGRYAKRAFWDAAHGQMALPEGTGDAPGWHAFWTGSREFSSRTSLATSHLCRFHAGTPLTAANEVHGVFVCGRGMDVTAPGGGSATLPAPRGFSYYAATLAMDGQLTLWRKGSVSDASVSRIALGSTSLGALAADVWYVMEFQVRAVPGQPATLMARAWPEGAARPASWQVTSADPSPLLGGVAGVLHLRGSSYSVEPAWYIAGFTVSELALSPPSTLAFSATPGTSRTGVSLSPSPQVMAVDAYGDIAVSFNGAVSLALKGSDGGDPPAGALLSGTTTVNAQGGLGAFPGLSIAPAGTYRLLAQATADGLSLSALSAAFSVSDSAPPPTTGSVAFLASPADGFAGDAFAPVPEVEIRTSGGARDTGFNGAVTLSLASAPAGAALAGETTVTATAGVARFPGVTSFAHGAYTLKADAVDRSAGTSAGFTLSPAVYTYIDPGPCCEWLVPQGPAYDGHFPQALPSGKPWRIDGVCLVIPPLSCEISDNPTTREVQFLNLTRTDVVEALDGTLRRTSPKTISLGFPKMGPELFDLLNRKRQFGEPLFLELGGLRDAEGELAYTPSSGDGARTVYYGTERAWRQGSARVFVDGTEATSGFFVDHEAGTVTFGAVQAEDAEVRLSYVWQPKLIVADLKEAYAPTQAERRIVSLNVTLHEIRW